MIVIPGLTLEDLTTLRKQYAELSRKERYGICTMLADQFGLSNNEIIRMLLGRMVMRGRGKKRRKVRVFCNTYVGERKYLERPRDVVPVRPGS